MTYEYQPGDRVRLTVDAPDSSGDWFFGGDTGDMPSGAEGVVDSVDDDGVEVGYMIRLDEPWASDYCAFWEVRREELSRA